MELTKKEAGAAELRRFPLLFIFADPQHSKLGMLADAVSDALVDTGTEQENGHRSTDTYATRYGRERLTAGAVTGSHGGASRTAHARQRTNQDEAAPSLIPPADLASTCMLLKKRSIAEKIMQNFVQRKDRMRIT